MAINPGLDSSKRCHRPKICASGIFERGDANNGWMTGIVKRQCEGAQINRALDVQKTKADVVKHELLTVSTLRSVSIYPSVCKPPILLHSLPILRSRSQCISRRRPDIGSKIEGRLGCRLALFLPRILILVSALEEGVVVEVVRGAHGCL